MAVSEETHKLIAAFQRYIKTSDNAEIDKYSISELKKADRELGWRGTDSGFRFAIKDQIKSIEQADENKKQSHIRTVGYVIALAIALIATIVGLKLL